MGKKKTDTQRVLLFILGIFNILFGLISFVVVSESIDFENDNFFKILGLCVLLVFNIYVAYLGFSKIEKSIK